MGSGNSLTLAAAPNASHWQEKLALFPRRAAPQSRHTERVKLHRTLCLGVVSALDAIFAGGQVAARAVENGAAQNPKWGKRDRAFVAQNLYEIVRWRRALEHAAQSHEPWALLAAQLLKTHEILPDWDEFSGIDAPAIRARLDASDLPRAIRESIPDWLDELGQSQLGARWDAEIAALNGEAPVVLRANTLKISRDNLQKRLLEAETETEVVEELPDALQLKTRRALGHLLLYKEGFFEIQDGASQLVAPFLRVEAGMRVLDACAGAGGKSLHLAALMSNRGLLTSCDVAPEKLIELRRRAARAGVSCLQTRPPEKLSGEFERVLIDAPCSGLGTLRRQPDLKWRLTPEFLAQIEAKQREILEFYAPKVARGGRMVYATCSILPGENQRQIDWFLGRNIDFELEESRAISVAETGFDGFFMARLRRIG